MFHVEVDWRYGVDPLVVQAVELLDVPDERIKVISETEVIILNETCESE